MMKLFNEIYAKDKDAMQHLF